jgi:hypothetical protein
MTRSAASPLTAQVDQLNFAGGAAQEVGAEALELFYGVGSETADFGFGGGTGGGDRGAAIEELDGGLGGGFG